jgi:hypothetical protein
MSIRSIIWKNKMLMKITPNKVRNLLCPDGKAAESVHLGQLTKNIIFHSYLGDPQLGFLTLITAYIESPPPTPK